jgi:hypothetical protein
MKGVQQVFSNSKMAILLRKVGDFGCMLGIYLATAKLDFY